MNAKQFLSLASLLAFCACSPEQNTAPGLGFAQPDVVPQENDEEQGSPGLGGLGGASFAETEPEPLAATACDSIACPKDQQCEEDGGQAICTCLPGFLGEYCHDDNECAASSELCGAGSTCVNLPGGFDCECRTGYQTNGSTCENRDECAGVRAPCDEGATCVDHPGGFTCNCAPGLFGDGIFCKSVDACQGGPCNAGTCRNNLTGYVCACPLGTSGPNCADTCPLLSPIIFESPVLAQAVSRALGMSGPVTPKDLIDLESLSLPSPDDDESTQDEVTSLWGLECLPTLKALRLPGHPVWDLTTLASLGSLVELELTCSGATDFSPLGALAGLKKLWLSNGYLCEELPQIESLDFAVGLTDLRELSVEGHKISDLSPLSALRRLTYLNLSDNVVENLHSLAELSQLEEIDLSHNPLTDLSLLSGLPSLARLALRANPGASFSTFAPGQGLVEVDLRENGLACASLKQEILKLYGPAVTIIGACEVE